MSPEVGGDAGPPVDRSPRWRIPFWALQVLELGVAFLLVTQSVHVGHGGLLVAAGIVFALLALTADGPLGVLRVCGQRLHVLVVAGLAIGCAALAFVPALRPDAEGLLVIVCAVVAVVYLATRTVTGSGRSGRRSRRTAHGPVIDVTATEVPSPSTGAQRPAGADAGADDPHSVLRKAGRATGAAAVVGKRVVDDHRPQVEDQVKRTLRGAGRLAGRLAGPKTPPADPPA
jgi:hypothetical protein